MRKLLIGIFLLIATLVFTTSVTAKPAKPEQLLTLDGDIEGVVTVFGHWRGDGQLYLSESFDVGDYDFPGTHYGHVVTDEGKGSRRSTGRQARFMFWYRDDVDGDGIEDVVEFYSSGYPGEVIKDKKQYSLVFDDESFFLHVRFLNADGSLRDYESWFIDLTFTVAIT